MRNNAFDERTKSNVKGGGSLAPTNLNKPALRSFIEEVVKGKLKKVVSDRGGQKESLVNDLFRASGDNLTKKDLR
jgi:hypothetical protein